MFGREIVSAAPVLQANILLDKTNQHFLQNTWGSVIVDDLLWVVSSGTDIISSYFLNGTPAGINLLVPGKRPELTSQPTGIVYYSGNQFPVTTTSVSPASFSSALIICTKTGTVHGYNYNLDPTTAPIVIDNSQEGASYTGIGIHQEKLYLADFSTGNIVVYNSSWERINVFFQDLYFDNPIPDSFFVNNVTVIRDVIYLTYVEKENNFEKFGCGKGFVSTFLPDGTFLSRFASGGLLNAPWEIIEAPSVWGFPAGSIIVGNVGGGGMAVYQPSRQVTRPNQPISFSGISLGFLQDSTFQPISCRLLRSMCVSPVSPSVVYFTCNTDSLRNGIIGYLTTCSPTGLVSPNFSQ